MTTLDPKDRTRRGVETEEAVTAAVASEPRTLFEASRRDFVFAEIWTRPGLDLRARYLTSLASAACANDGDAVRAYARGALQRKELALSELREAALHIAVYGGWSAGAVLDRGVTAAAADLGFADEEFAPIRTEPWDAQERLDVGAASFRKVMAFGGPPPQTAYFEGGILYFVFAEMWNREGLDERARRFLTLVGVSFSSAATPIRSHVWSAMASGNATAGELFEFVLQFAIHAGWPRASFLQGVVFEMADKVKRGVGYDG